jgi:erythromycin esterase-like protein
MISATGRWVDRDFSSNTENAVKRDGSMFQNFEWLQSRPPKRHKVLVWAATVHIAKQGDPTWGDLTGRNFGSFIHRSSGNHPYSLGFSSLSGSYRQGKGNFPAMPSPPPNSVEVQALHDGSAGTAFVDQSRLAAMGMTSGAFFRHSYQTFEWSEFLDGVVIFQAEYPPGDTRAK